MNACNYKKLNMIYRWPIQVENFSGLPPLNFGEIRRGWNENVTSSDTQGVIQYQTGHGMSDPRAINCEKQCISIRGNVPGCYILSAINDDDWNRLQNCNKTGRYM